MKRGEHAPAKLSLAAVAALLATLLPAAAQAGIEERFGLGTRATALAGSVGARPGSFAAAWYNPGAIAASLDPAVDRPGFVQLTVGGIFARPMVHVQDLGGQDMSDRVTGPAHDVAGFWLGARFDLGHAIGLEGLTAALSVYMPGKNIFRWSIRPDEELQWMFLTDRSHHISIDAGVAYRVAPWLSIGIGLRILFDTETLTLGQVESFEYDTDPETGEMSVRVSARLGEDVRVVGRFAPTVGILAEPHERLRLGLTYRARTFVDDYGWTRIEQVPILGTIGYVHRFLHYYQPHQVAASVAVNPIPSLCLSLDLTWANWSDARTVNAARPERGFRDTWTPAAGASWDSGRGLHVLAGYRFDPAPFSSGGGETNLLVNDQHVFGLGLELRLHELTGQDELRYTFMVAGQLHSLVRNEERKRPERFVSDEVFQDNPGYPGYRYGGTVPTVSASVMAEW
jgi:long-chain fatty acid transport protein